MAPIISCRRIFPPYHPNLVWTICCTHILYFAVVLAIHQTFWMLSTQIFPIAYDMFADTQNRQPDFFWNQTHKQQLDRYQIRLFFTWAISTFAISIAMLCIIPLFCTAEMHEQEVDLCIRRPRIAQMMAPLFVLVSGLIAGCLLTERLDCVEDDRLFHSLFNGAIKEEIYSSRFEESLHCVSDEDKEGYAGILGFDVMKCDRIMERAVLNANWLDPLLISHLLLTVTSVFGCIFFNRQEKIVGLDDYYSEVDMEENGDEEE